jgi:hypothetical protein
MSLDKADALFNEGEHAEALAEFTALIKKLTSKKKAINPLIHYNAACCSKELG